MYTTAASLFIFWWCILMAAEKKPKHENPRRQYKKFLFAQNYILRGMNVPEALAAAGYSPKNTTAAWKFLRDPEVLRYMRAILEDQQEKLGEIYRADKENIINELTKIAFFDPRRVARIEDGRVKIVDSDEITNIEAAAIAEMTETNKGLRVKFHSKVDALDKLAKILGLYVEKHEVAGKDGEKFNIVFNIPRPDEEE